MRWSLLGVVCVASLVGCGEEPSKEAAVVEPEAGPEVEPEVEPEEVPEPEDPPNNDTPEVRRAALTHSFGVFDLEPFQEVENCVQWTLNNDETIYLERVSLSNKGSFHHSNWFVVPEGVFAGDDGYFECEDRGFQELTAAVQGAVLFAQSTQSRQEVQFLGEGVVIKVPPRHKVVAGVHMINLSPRSTGTELRMSLEILHPGEVRVVATPFRLTYEELDIPARSDARFTGECDLSRLSQELTGAPFTMKLYYVLPHFHALGNHFNLEIHGGERDGEQVYELNGFNAEANGGRFDPPLDLGGALGLRFTCGFGNPRQESVGWGIGDQEMCVMLGFADSPLLYDAVVKRDSVVVEEGEGFSRSEGPCEVTPVPRNAAQGMPTQDEIEAPMYIPPTREGDEEIAPIIECEDTPADAVAGGPATLEGVKGAVFMAGCAFSACHDSTNPASGLDLSDEAGDLHEVLMAHEVGADTALPLVDPGNAEGSWLYKVLSICQPKTRDGVGFVRMPFGAPSLLDPSVVAQVRDWIDGGAESGR